MNPILAIIVIIVLVALLCVAVRAYGPFKFSFHVGTIPRPGQNDSDPEAGSKMYKEVMAVVDRYSQESDITVYETIGALEMAKDTMIRELDRYNNKTGDE